jgi:hypothetical protein
MKHKYRVWYIANPPGSPIYRYVHGPNEAALLIAEWAKADLEAVGIWGNAFGLQVYKYEEWQEWYSRDGDSITDLLDKTND